MNSKPENLLEKADYKATLGECHQYFPPWYVKWFRRLFPARYLETDLNKVTTMVHFDWRDRIRILVSGKLKVENAINERGEALRSEVCVLPPWTSFDHVKELSKQQAELAAKFLEEQAKKNGKLA